MSAPVTQTDISGDTCPGFWMIEHTKRADLQKAVNAGRAKELLLQSLEMAVDSLKYSIECQDFSKLDLLKFDRLIRLTVKVYDPPEYSLSGGIGDIPVDKP